MGNVAAPFLAGFSLTVFVITLTLKEGAARWPDLALLLFMLAAFILIATVQFMFWARHHLVTPRDLMDWYPDWMQPFRRTQLSRYLRVGNGRFRRRANVARVLYGLGLLCLFAGLTILAVPPEVARTPALRWAAVWVGSAATVAEFVWVVLALTSGRLRP
ncbi:hypothetical protein [Streptomyces sioyaensis]